MPTTPKHTTLGTPCARSWSNDWIATVDATEQERNHRICGARLPDATPCCNQSDHPSGRCQYHGGFDLTGAPPGNRNHVIHGLYSRRLRPCTQTCPHWQTCPIASQYLSECGEHANPASHPNRHPRENGDPSSQSVPNPCETGAPSSQFPAASGQSHTSDPTDRPDPSDSSLQTPASGLQPSPNPQSPVRNPQLKSSLQSPASGLQPTSPPTCVYQQIEYNTVLTDALAIVESQPHPNPMGIHTAHNVATLQVLVSTAAAQLTQASSLFEVPRASSPCPPAVPWASSPCRRPSSSEASEAPQTPTPNPNAILAFTRLMREYRHTLKLLQAPGVTPLNRQNSAGAPPTAEGVLRHTQRMQHDTNLDPDSIADAQLEPQTPETHAKAYIQQAALAAGQGRDVEMCEAFDNAALLDEAYAESERSHVLASYRPARHSVSEELAEAILGHLHLEPPTPNGNYQHTDNTTPQNSSTTRSNTNEFATPIPPSKGDQGGCSSENATTTGPINQAEVTPDANDILQYYLDLIRDGKMPPEAFPIGSPYRVQAEANNASPPATVSNPDREGGPATPEFPDGGGSAPA